MATKKFFGTFNDIQKQTYTPGAIYYDIETGGVFQDTPQGRIQSIDGVGTLIDDTIGTSELSTPSQSAQLVISRKDLTTNDVVEEEEENDLEEQSDIADAEEESSLIVSQANRDPIALNSLLAEKEGEIAWRTKYQLFKKRIYLYREYTANETLFEFANIPYIEPNPANVVNFINRTANIRPEDIYPKGPGDSQIWFLNRNTPELRNKPVVVSSVLVFDRKPVHVLEQRKYGDIPSKFVEDQNKVDIILFKNVAIDYTWQNSDKILGDLIYDYKLTKLRELEANAFNGWSAEFVEPDLETEETYAIALSLTSNRIPSFIYEGQWSWPPKPVRTQPADGEDGEDGKDARNVFLTADKALTITYAANGTSPNPSGTIIFTATPQNFENAEYSFNGGAFSSTNTFNYTIPANISELTPAINISVDAREVSDNSIGASDIKTVSGVKPGATGSLGAVGPGLTYRGRFDSSKVYFHNATRKDVVSILSGEDEVFYIVNNTAKHNTNTWTTPPNNDWTSFDQNFSSVATSILLAQEATITRGLTIGVDEENTDLEGYVRSAGVNSIDNLQTGIDTGFWLDNNGTIAANRGFFGPVNLGLWQNLTEINQNISFSIPLFGSNNINSINNIDDNIFRYEITFTTGTGGFSYLYIVNVEFYDNNNNLIKSDFMKGSINNGIPSVISGNLIGKFISTIVIKGEGVTLDGSYPAQINGSITYNNQDQALFKAFETEISTGGSFTVPSIETSSINVESIKMQAPNPVRTINSNTSINLSLYGEFIVVESGTVTITIPRLTTSSTIPNIIGTEIHIFKETTGEVTITPSTGVTLLSEGNKRRINDRYQAVTLKNIGLNKWILLGALKT